MSELDDRSISLALRRELEKRDRLMAEIRQLRTALAQLRASVAQVRTGSVL